MATLLHEQTPVLPEAEPQSDETLRVARIVREIVDSWRDLHSRRNEINFARQNLLAKDLPTTPMPSGAEATSEERQGLALDDLEVYAQVFQDPELLKQFGGRQPILEDYSWERTEESGETVPVYTKLAIFNPHIALLLNFDLDKNGWATDSSARLMMSLDASLLSDALKVVRRAGHSPDHLAA
jgi:hypothetical protein